MAPQSLDGILVNLFSHLPIAGSHHWTLGLMEIQAPLIPVQTEEIQDLARPTLLIGNQLLVRHVQNRSRRQYPAPACNDALMLPSVVRPVRQIRSLTHR